MRCLTLAAALAERGTHCSFLVNPEAVSAAPALARSGFRIDLTHSDDIPDDADLVIFDHYGIAAGVEASARRAGRRILVIDDLANRQHCCDLLLDQTIGRAPIEYASLVERDCTMLIGNRFALLRPEFAAARPAALERRAGSVRTIMVSMGMTDLGGITAQIVERLVAHLSDVRIDIVLAATAASHAAVSALATSRNIIRVFPADSDMAALMSHADLAIGAAGTTSWERCCLGLPTIMLILADNQKRVAAELAARCAALLATDVNQAVSLAHKLLRDKESLCALSSNAADLIDGHGTARVCEAIMALFDDAPQG